METNVIGIVENVEGGEESEIIPQTQETNLNLNINTEPEAAAAVTMENLKKVIPDLVEQVSKLTSKTERQHKLLKLISQKLGMSCAETSSNVSELFQYDSPKNTSPQCSDIMKVPQQSFQTLVKKTPKLIKHDIAQSDIKAFLKKSLNQLQRVKDIDEKIGQLSSRQSACAYCGIGNLKSTIKRHLSNNKGHVGCLTREQILDYQNLIKLVNEEHYQKYFPCPKCPKTKVFSIEKHVADKHAYLPIDEQTKMISSLRSRLEMIENPDCTMTTTIDDTQQTSTSKVYDVQVDSAKSSDSSLERKSSEKKCFTAFTTEVLILKFEREMRNNPIWRPAKLGKDTSHTAEIKCKYLDIFFQKFKLLKFNLNMIINNKFYRRFYKSLTTILLNFNKHGLKGTPWSVSTIEIRSRFLIEFFRFIRDQNYITNEEAANTLIKYTSRVLNREVKKSKTAQIAKEKSIKKAQEEVWSVDKYYLILENPKFIKLYKEMLNNDITINNYVKYRDVVLLIFFLCTAPRSGVVSNLTLDHYNNKIISEQGYFCIEVEEHKTATQHGDTTMMLPKNFIPIFDLYITFVRSSFIRLKSNAGESNENVEYFFVTSKGNKMTTSCISKTLNDFILTYLIIPNMPFSANRIRKWSVFDTINASEASLHSNSELLQHNPKTAEKFYYSRQKEARLDAETDKISQSAGEQESSEDTVMGEIEDFSQSAREGEAPEDDVMGEIVNGREDSAVEGESPEDDVMGEIVEGREESAVEGESPEDVMGEIVQGMEDFSEIENSDSDNTKNNIIFSEIESGSDSESDFNVKRRQNLGKFRVISDSESEPNKEKKLESPCKKLKLQLTPLKEKTLHQYKVINSPLIKHLSKENLMELHERQKDIYSRTISSFMQRSRYQCETLDFIIKNLDNFILSGRNPGRGHITNTFGEQYIENFNKIYCRNKQPPRDAIVTIAKNIIKALKKNGYYIATLYESDSE